MNPQPKPRRVTDRKYLRWIKRQECLVLRSRIYIEHRPSDWVCVGPMDPHHVKPVSLGGSDFLAVPLCRNHHNEAQRSNARFETKYAIQFSYEIERLRKEYAAQHPEPRTVRKPRKPTPRTLQLKKFRNEVKKLEGRIRRIRLKMGI